ncbi:MAG: tellurite resistance/C4-dicarboxylate transporter family protein [Proteobacteria bacterium]|nr:tellurite resistance/C4-dicarboxylate transporter family protein [Pseudomonadota bacterium]
MPDTRLEAIRHGLHLRRLHPAYFALVMATGIVSIALRDIGLRVIPDVLLAINATIYPALILISLARLVAYPRECVADLADHHRSQGYFTFVAATAVMGLECRMIGAPLVLVRGLWWLAAVAWLIVIYAVFVTLIVKRRKPRIERGLDGGWLLSIVATQAVAILGAALAPLVPAHAQAHLFFALVLWLIGGMLYIWIISMIFYRSLFFRLDPRELTPPYWISMGAVAISTLAGVFLLDFGARVPAIAAAHDFIVGFTLLFWATATWWIPLLIALEAWRHLWKRYPLSYEPLDWGAVFPFGMYATCTFNLARVLDTTALRPLAEGFAWAALALWLATFIGWIVADAPELVRATFRKPPAHPPR